jgi:hypothetical protein
MRVLAAACRKTDDENDGFLSKSEFKSIASTIFTKTSKLGRDEVAWLTNNLKGRNPKHIMYAGEESAKEGDASARAGARTPLTSCSGEVHGRRAKQVSLGEHKEDARLRRHPNRARVWGPRAKGFTGGGSPPTAPPLARFRRRSTLLRCARKTSAYYPLH